MSLRQERISSGDCNSLLVRCIADPELDIGSGGACINALLCTAEFLSAKMGHSVLHADCLQNRSIFIFLEGRLCPAWDVVSNTFLTLADEADLPCANIVSLYRLCRQWAAQLQQPRVWFISTDICLHLADQAEKDSFQSCLQNNTEESCLLLSVLTPEDNIHENGVLKLTQESYLEKLVFQHSPEEFASCKQSNDLYPTACGLLALRSDLAIQLLYLHAMPPLDGTCYSGIDNGAAPVSVSLFFDIIASMCPQWSQENANHDYCVREFHFASNCAPSQQQDQVATPVERLSPSVNALLKRHLGERYRVKVLVMRGEVAFPSMDGRHQLQACLAFSQYHYNNPPPAMEEDNHNLLINCLLQPAHIQFVHCIARNCELTLSDQLAEASNAVQFTNCLLSGLSSDAVTKLTSVYGCDVNHLMAVQCRVHNADVLLCKSISSPSNEYAIHLIKEVVDEGDYQTQFTHVEDAFTILNNVNALRELKWRRTLLEYRMEHWLMQLFSYPGSGDDGAFQSGFDSPTRLPFSKLLHSQSGYKFLTILDNFIPRVATLDIPRITKYLYIIADILGIMSRNEAGVRSGPANNARFSAVFKAIHNVPLGRRTAKDDCVGHRKAADVVAAADASSMANALHDLRQSRDAWLVSANHSQSQFHTYLRCARHYEGAANLLIAKVVFLSHLNVQQQVSTVRASVRVTCPARLDVAGGWSDTPPITYEHGGAVLNVSIQVNGKNPIGAEVEEMPSNETGARILIVLEDDRCLELTTLDELLDYHRPYAVGSLVKAVLALVFDIPSGRYHHCPDPLQACLKHHLRSDASLKVRCWSVLPMGSGLGTSSILAGGLVYALWSFLGQSVHKLDVVHTVLKVEQMMTTGGGWQDQVGGLMADGIRLARSSAAQPLSVVLSPEDFINVPSASKKAALMELESRILLIYTGISRLAKNLLQEVLRRWYCGADGLDDMMDEVVRNAEECAAAFLQCDWASVGRHLNQYWRQKGQLVPSCAPQRVTQLMQQLSPHCYGQSLMGAGGGGFLLAILKSHESRPDAESVVSQFNKIYSADLQLYSASIDLLGVQME